MWQWRDTLQIKNDDHKRARESMSLSDAHKTWQELLQACCATLNTVRMSYTRTNTGIPITGPDTADHYVVELKQSFYAVAYSDYKGDVKSRGLLKQPRGNQEFVLTSKGPVYDTPTQVPFFGQIVAATKGVSTLALVNKSSYYNVEHTFYNTYPMQARERLKNAMEYADFALHHDSILVSPSQKEEYINVPAQPPTFIQWPIAQTT